MAVAQKRRAVEGISSKPSAHKLGSDQPWLGHLVYDVETREDSRNITEDVSRSIRCMHTDEEMIKEFWLVAGLSIMRNIHISDHSTHDCNPGSDPPICVP